MKEAFERETYLKVAKDEFLWKLQPEIKGILSG